MKPRVVVFDLGKVLVDFDYLIAAKRIAPHCERLTDPVRFFSDHASLLTSYELGLLTTQQFFDQIREASTFSGTLAQFTEFFSDIFTGIDPMIDLHKQVRDQRIPTYVFSNTNDLAVEHIRRKFPFFSEFSGYVLSYEHRVMKPAARLYEIVERASGRKGEEILYIDDRQENVDAGAARGWQTVLHEDPAKTREVLKAVGAVNHS